MCWSYIRAYCIHARLISEIVPLKFQSAFRGSGHTNSGHTNILNETKKFKHMTE